MRKKGPEGRKALSFETAGAAGEVVDILATAVIGLIAAGAFPRIREPGETCGTRLVPAPPPHRAETLLSPPHRASMSGPGGAHTPPAKEDEHG